MIKLVIMNWTGGRSRFFEVLFNPDYIICVRDGGVDIVGQSYVEILPCSEASKSLPCDEYGWVAVKGNYDEITQMIIKAKGGVG